jgi:hypothetical protein
MSTILRFTIDDLTPDRSAVFEGQGIAPGQRVPAQIEAIYGRTLALLTELGAPRVILAELSRADFEPIYHAEGRNEARTPVGDLLGRATGFALFAATLGQRVSEEITERFRSNEFAFGAMLDAAASVAADNLSDRGAEHFRASLCDSDRASPTVGVMPYSPGYCGWHISGQKKLFEFLRPEQIDITLTDRYLMQPLKSVSGVLIAGPKQIHDLPMSYPACSQCTTQSCRARIRALLAQ